MINRSLVFFLLLAAATAVKLTSDSYIELAPQGYTFQVQDGKLPVSISIANMPPGLAIANYTLLTVGAVPKGQYILSVKASDAAGSSDEKILIVNVGSTVSSSSSATSTTNTQEFTQSSSSAVAAVSTQTGSPGFDGDISSISAMFGGSASSSAGQAASSSPGSVNSLQDYFNQIDVGSVSSNPGGSLSGSSLSAILTDFSNATENTETHVVDVSTFSQNLVAQSSISLNFSDTQKSTVATEQANALFLQQKLAS